MYKQLVAKLMKDQSDLKDQLSHALQDLGEVYRLVETTPNNMQLGKRVRQYYYESHE